MTPEVGSEAGGFFPERADIKAIAVSNFPFLRYVLLKTGFELSKVSVDAHHGTVSIFNGGLDSSFGKFIRLALLTTTLGVIFREIEKISKRSNFTFDISAEKGEMIIIISSFCLIEDSVPVTCRCGAPGGEDVVFWEGDLKSEDVELCQKLKAWGGGPPVPALPPPPTEQSEHRLRVNPNSGGPSPETTAPAPPSLLFHIFKDDRDYYHYYGPAVDISMVLIFSVIFGFFLRFLHKKCIFLNTAPRYHSIIDESVVIGRGEP